MKNILTGIHRHTTLDTEKPDDSAEKMRRVSLFFNKKQLQKLQILSKNTGAPQSEIIRRAVDIFLTDCE